MRNLESKIRLSEIQQDLLLVQQRNVLKETLETKGWKEIISPLLDKMIIDVVGGKNGNVWDSGSFGDKRLGDVRADKLLWYRQALIEFNNHIYSILNAGERADERIKENSVNEDPKIVSPMIDGAYSDGEEKDKYGYEINSEGE